MGRGGKGRGKGKKERIKQIYFEDRYVELFEALVLLSTTSLFVNRLGRPLLFQCHLSVVNWSWIMRLYTESKRVFVIKTFLCC